MSDYIATPSSRAPSGVARLLAATLAFLVLAVGVVGGGVYFLRHRGGATAGANRTGPRPEADPATDLFYGKVGLAPDGFAPVDANAAPALAASFTLELKVTSSRPEAEALIDSLAKKGLEAYYTPLSRAGRVVYRVRRGIFSSHKDAARAQVALKADQGVASNISKLN